MFGVPPLGGCILELPRVVWHCIPPKGGTPNGL